MRQWLSVTHGTSFELTRHFLRRFFDNEWIADGDQLRSWVGGIFAIQLSLFLLIVRAWYTKYLNLAALPEATAWLYHTLSDRLFLYFGAMVWMVLLGSFLWSALFPDARDMHNLLPLPVSGRQIFACKLAAVAALLSLFLLATVVPGALGLSLVRALPASTEAAWTIASPGWGELGRHLLAGAAACVFTVLAIMALQGIALHAAPRRWRQPVSLAMQAGLLTLGLACFPLVVQCLGLARSMGQRPAWGLLLPPVWFLGLCEWWGGNQEAYVAALARCAAIGLAAAAALTAVTYLLSYSRQTRSLLEETGEPHRTGSRLTEWLVRHLVRQPEQQAVAAFTLLTLGRSRFHRVLLAVYAGVGGTLLVHGVMMLLVRREWTQSAAVQDLILTTPLALLFMLLFGLRHAFAVPIEHGAHWPFQLLGDRAPLLLDAVDRLCRLLVLFVLAVVSPLIFLAVEWPLAVLYLAMGWLLGMTLVEGILRGWHKLPFTCSFLPGRRNLVHTLSLGMVLLGLFAYSTTGWLLTSYGYPYRLLVLFGMLIALWAKLRQARLATWGQQPLEFDEHVEQVIQSLALARE